MIDDHRLAYVSEAPVNWCPGLGTVLANEEVTADGRSDRGNYPVFRRNMRQWKMRITAYADRLIDDLDVLDWPDSIKTMQRNWIGRSEGATLSFTSGAGPIEVFTTRPDTLFGATFMVLAPEHPMVDALTAAAWPEHTRPLWTGTHATPAEAVAAYRAAAAAKSDLARQVEDREKTGVFTGSFAVNPATGDLIPIFIADYVLMGYGTGAIMAVPGQDDRDWEYAERFGLRIVRTVQPPDGWEGDAYLGDGPAINSANDSLDLNGLGVADAKAAMIAWLETNGHGGPRRPTACATGCSAASATGASRSPSSTTRPACPSACRSRCCPSRCPARRLPPAHARPRRRRLRARAAAVPRGLVGHRSSWTWATGRSATSAS